MAKGDFTNEMVLNAIDSNCLGSMDFLIDLMFLLTYDYSKNFDFIFKDFRKWLKLANDYEKLIRTFNLNSNEAIILKNYYAGSHLLSDTFYNISYKIGNCIVRKQYQNSPLTHCYFLLSSLTFIKKTIYPLLEIYNEKFKENEINKKVVNSLITIIYAEENYIETKNCLKSYEGFLKKVVPFPIRFLSELIQGMMKYHLGEKFIYFSDSKDFDRMLVIFYLCKASLNFKGANYEVWAFFTFKYLIENGSYTNKIDRFNFDIMKQTTNNIYINMEEKNGRTLLLRMIERIVSALNISNHGSSEDIRLNSTIEKLKQGLNLKYGRQSKYLSFELQNTIYIPILLRISSTNIPTFIFEFSMGISRYLLRNEMISKEDYKKFVNQISFTFYRKYMMHNNNEVNSNISPLDYVSYNLQKIIKGKKIKIVILIDEISVFNDKERDLLNQQIESISLFGIDSFTIRIDYIKSHKAKFRFKTLNFFEYLSQEHNYKTELPYAFNEEFFSSKVPLDEISNLFNSIYFGQSVLRIPVITKNDIEQFYEDRVNAMDVVKDIYNIIKSHQNRSEFSGYNIGIFGNYGVGKTSIIRMFIKWIEDQREHSTEFIRILPIQINVNEYSSQSLVEEVFQQTKNEVAERLIKLFELDAMLNYNQRMKVLETLHEIIHNNLNYGNVLKNNISIETECNKKRQHQKYKRVIVAITILIMLVTLFMTFVVPIARHFLLISNMFPSWLDKDYSFNYASIVATIPSFLASFFIYTALKDTKESELLSNKKSVVHLKSLLNFSEVVLNVENNLQENENAKKKIRKIHLKISNHFHKFQNKKLKKTTKLLNKYIDKCYELQDVIKFKKTNTLITLDNLDRLSNERITNILQGISYIQAEQKDSQIIFLVPFSYEKFYEETTFTLDEYRIKNEQNIEKEFIFKNLNLDESISIDNKHLNKIFDYKVFVPKLDESKISSFIKFVLEKPLQYNFFGTTKSEDWCNCIITYYKEMKIRNLRDISATLNDSFVYYDISKDLLYPIEFAKFVFIIILHICHLRYNFIEFAEELIERGRYIDDLIYRLENDYKEIKLYDESIWLKFKSKESINLNGLEDFLKRFTNLFNNLENQIPTPNRIKILCLLKPVLIYRRVEETWSSNSKGGKDDPLLNQCKENLKDESVCLIDSSIKAVSQKQRTRAKKNHKCKEVK